ncbi:serine hydrolase [Amedibacillus sp. YH-ame10]
MKKIIKVLVAMCMLFSVCLLPIQAESVKITGVDLAGSAKSAYLIENTTGKVIFAKNEKEKLYPASMTKMMGLLLIFEALNHQKISWKDDVTTSEYAASMGGSQVFLEVHETMSVKDMVKSICIASANDAMVAMAEKIGGTNDNFVEMMNAKAEELGLINTHFVNATGLHDPDHYTCAKDMGVLAQALIKEGGDEMLAITSTYDAYIRENSDNKFWLVNTNKLLKQYEGVDGLKTGFTSEALSCITVSAKRQDLRLIAVVMGAPSSKERNAIAKQMLDYGFSQYAQGLLYKKGSKLDEITFENGKPGKANIVALEDVSYVFEKGKEPKEKNKKIVITKRSLPYVKDKKIGYVRVEMSDGYYMEVPIGVHKTIEPLDYMDIFMKTFKDVFA